MSGIVPFTNDEFSLDLIPHATDGFHAYAPGVARALGFREAYDLLRSIPADEKGSELVRTPNGGHATVSYLTEAGFYRALGQRQAARILDPNVRDTVERFQKWVYGYVLPALRTGQLVPQQSASLVIPTTLPEALRLAADQFERAEAEKAARLVADRKVAELAPAAEAWEHLATADGDYLVADAAKILSNDPVIKVGERRLFTILSDLGWIYRGRGDNRWRTYQTAVESGRLSELPMSHYHPRNGNLILDPPQVRVTVKGIEYLRSHLAKQAQPSLTAVTS